MIMDESSPISYILALLRVPVYPDLFLAHPRFLREERMFEKSQEREGLAPTTPENSRWPRDLFLSHSSRVPARFKGVLGMASGFWDAEGIRGREVHCSSPWPAGKGGNKAREAFSETGKWKRREG
jgi:hypothetical protein